MDTDESAIVNGVTQSLSLYRKYGLVAIYHKNAGSWIPRPCSGKAIRSLNGVSHVLTARHCVTTNGFAGGPLETVLSNVRVIASPNPGIAAPEPPAGAVAISQIIADVANSATMTLHDLIAHDIAILRVNADFSLNVASRQGFYMADPGLLAENLVSTYAYGYGLVAGDASCFTDKQIATGAGTARRGGPFVVDRQLFNSAGVLLNGYLYVNSNSLGHKVICGDSGGPDVTTFGMGSTAWGVQLGIHSDGFNSMSNNVPSEFVGQTFGGFYLSPYADHGINLRVVQNAVVIADTSPAASTGLFRYFASDRSIRGGGKCMGFGLRADQTVGPVMETCSSAATQRWDLTVDQRIVNVGADGTCLTLGGAGVQLQGCTSTGTVTDEFQRWAWHVQP